MVIGTPCPPIGGLTFIKGAPFAVPGPPGHGRVLVLEFWATWCGPCVQTVPHLTEIQHAYRERGVTVLGISTENNVQKVRQFVDSKGSTMDYTVAVDLGGEATEGLLRAAGARGIPHAFIVDASNTIRYSGHPMDPSFQTALQQAVATAGSASSGAAPKPGGEALPLISASFEELMGMSVKELKGLLAERGISMAGAAEKADLARLVQEQASKDWIGADYVRASKPLARPFTTNLPMFSNTMDQVTKQNSITSAPAQLRYRMLAASRLPTSQRAFSTTSRRSCVLVQAKFSYAPLVDAIGKEMMKKDIPKVKVGDTVKANVAVVEGKGKTRTQKLEGTIIAEHGAGINKTVTFRRVFQGIGIELIMPLHSPALQGFEHVRTGRVRRAKLYFLRSRVGKAAKLKEVIVKRAAKVPKAAAPKAAAPEAAAPEVAPAAAEAVPAEQKA
ncbi:hypothetical protein QJQ45_029822 [Haematococcus lacustris]|nr:hypothetical protein QJQ45_029822 [Haematococcus lacustris]